MYNTHETITVQPEREYDEKRQADALSSFGLLFVTDDEKLQY